MSSHAIARLLDSGLAARAPWTVVDDMSGGSQGAYLVEDANGAEAVAKIHRGAPLSWFRAVDRRVDLLRGRGVPAPEMIVLAVEGDVLLVLDRVPGAVDPPLTLALVERLLRINALQAGAADGPADEWRALMRQSLAQGLDGYCEHASLSAFSDDSRRLLGQIRAVADHVNFDSLPADDLVHYDLHPGNILSADGQHVSGIVDWDAVRVGDRLLDLAMLTFTAMWRAEPPVLDRLWFEFFAIGDAQRRSVAMHHAVLRLVDWLIRHDTDLIAERTVTAGGAALASLAAGRYSPSHGR